MTRTELLNMLIALNRYHAYLEIGTQHADNNFNKINAAIKVSVDPDPRAKAMHKCTSDAFFAEHAEKIKDKLGAGRFGLVFIDGFHHADQAERDIINSMRVLEPGGTIVLHDCNPKEEWQQLVPRQHKEWYGDVWRAFVGYRLKYPYHVSFCLDHDCGLGVIKYNEEIQPGFVTDMPWQEFDKNRKQLLGII